MADLEKIEDAISFSQLSLESGIYQIWDYLKGILAEKQEQPKEEAFDMKKNNKWEKRIHKLLYGKWSAKFLSFLKKFKITQGPS